MNDNSTKNRIESEALLDYVNSKIAIYVADSGIYKYAYNNSEAFRKFVSNTSNEMNNYFDKLRKYNGVKKFRKGFVGVAVATTVFAPFAIASGISSTIKTNKIKNSVHTPEFEDFFNFLAEKRYEGVVLDYTISQLIFDKAKKLDVE